MSDDIKSHRPMGEDSAMFRVSQLDDRPEDVVVGPVSKKIDPMVEFNDVFQDIRRAEKGDDKKPSERYFDTDLFATPLEEKSKEDNEKRYRKDKDREERVKGGKLNLHAGAGGLADRIERQVGAPQERLEASDMIAAALAESGLREPSVDTDAVSEGKKKPKVVDLDVSGDARGEDIAFSNAGRFFAALLVLVLCCVGTLGFIASRNDGIFDFRDVDQMLGVAFKGQEYQPRHVSVIRIVDGEEVVVGDSVADAIDLAPHSLDVGDVEGGRYEAAHGANFALVDGVVTNNGDTNYRAIAVTVELIDPEGNVVDSRTVRAGAAIAQPELEAVEGAAELDSAYAALEAGASELTIAPGQEIVFNAAFARDPAAADESLTFTARVHSAERESGSCWGRVEFNPPSTPEPADDGSGS